MLNLFRKKPQVRTGKNDTQAAGEKKKTAPFAAFGNTWKKLNSMDRKQAYTWGAVGIACWLGLLLLGSAASSANKEDFSDFETRGYDLANMPFSSDEAEQYLLASKYPDMQGIKAAGLYDEDDKAERQEEDAAALDNLYTGNDNASEDGSTGGGYYGGGRRGGGGRTQVGSLNSASLKGAQGSGMSGAFGPTGDFSNFRSQNKGSDKFTPQNAGSGNARKALFQTAMGSRAAAGLKNDKMLNAKKALMGGNVNGSGAFLNDSGAVDLGASRGLELDTNAPVSSADLTGMDDALKDGADKGNEDTQTEDEKEWWEELLIDVAKTFATNLVNMGMTMAQNSLQDSQNAAAAGRAQAEQDCATWKADMGADQKAQFGLNQQSGKEMEFPSSAVTNEQKMNYAEQQLRNAGYEPGQNGTYTRGRGLKSDRTVTIGADGTVTTSDGQPFTWDKKEIKNINNSFQKTPEYKQIYDSGYTAGKNSYRGNSSNYSSGGNLNTGSGSVTTTIDGKSTTLHPVGGHTNVYQNPTTGKYYTRNGSSYTETASDNIFKVGN